MMDQSLSSSASHVSAVRNAIFGDFFWLLGLPEASPWRHRLTPLLQPVVGRFADLAAEFDQAVAQVGLASAIRPYYSRFAERVTVTGMETLPATGPLLVVSNHPGAYDLFLILSSLPRDDVKVIVSEISILHRLPAFRSVLHLHRAFRQQQCVGRQGRRASLAGRRGALLVSWRHRRPRSGLYAWRCRELGTMVAKPGAFPAPCPGDAGCRRDRQRRPVARLVQQPGHPAASRTQGSPKSRRGVPGGAANALAAQHPDRPLVTFDRPFAVSELSRDGSAGSWLAAIEERATALGASRRVFT